MLPFKTLFAGRSAMRAHVASSISCTYSETAYFRPQPVQPRYTPLQGTLSKTGLPHFLHFIWIV